MLSPVSIEDVHLLFSVNRTIIEINHRHFKDEETYA